MRILFADDTDISLNGDVDFSELKAIGDYHSLPNGSVKEIVEHSDDTEIIVVNKAQITVTIFQKLKRLRLVAVTASGYNNVDIQAAQAAGVTVTNVAGYASETVAQHTFSLILNLATKADRYANDVKLGHWQNSSSFTLLRYHTFEIRGLIIGIIGFGAIGREVARIAEGFRMRVLVHRRRPNRTDSYPNTSLDNLLASSDFVTIHTPLTEETHNMINSAALDKMKATAYLINTARGGLVDETALSQRLHQGQLAGAGFDVLSTEPPSASNPLLQAPNIIVTPHSAWSTRDSRQKLIDETVINIRSFIAGKPRNIVTE